MGDKLLPGISAEDIGKCAFGIFENGEKYIGKSLGIAGEHLTCSQMADALSKAMGKEIVYNNVPPEVFRSFGFPGAEDIGNMFQFHQDFEEDFTGFRPVSETKSLNPELQNFDTWLSRNKEKIPME